MFSIELFQAHLNTKFIGHGLKYLPQTNSTNENTWEYFQDGNGEYNIEEDFEDGVVSNSEYNLSHILISAPESATIEDFTTIEREAEDIHEQLIAGANFGEIAIQYSDSQTGLDGGSLGWRKGCELPTIFSDILKSLKVD